MYALSSRRQGECANSFLPPRSSMTPGVTSAIIGPRTMPHLDDLLAGAGVQLSDDLLDRIDAVVAPGTDSGAMGATYEPPARVHPALRRRPLRERAAS